MQFNEIYEITTNEDKNEYHFTTSLNYHYNVYFLPAKEEYFSEYPDIPDNIYLFGFSLLNTGVGMMPFDFKIAQTICRILVDFFDNHKNIIIFICDSVDKRERQRNITFSKWFHHFDTEHLFEKTDKILEYDSENRYYLSLVYRKDNPDKELYLDAFFKITSGMEK